jgi:23S rRNA pseudouridine955/2504/2580 synthase|tara:strand:- start:1953 stop:2867 length:915 start_codon:yes stop_codon:yes gene_type:complete
MTVKKIEVSADNAGRRLDNYLFSIYKNVPKSKLYNIIRKGELRINSGRVKPNRKLEVGDLIRIPPNLENSESPDRKINIPPKMLITLRERIIYEDGNYIVLNKPAGLAVHGGTDNSFGVIDVLRQMFDDSIDLCHRIDKDTSGCLVLSKNKLSNRHFNSALVAKSVTKKYITILKGHLKSGLKVDVAIEKSFDTQTKSTISSEGKDSASFFKPLQKLNQCSLVEVEIYTGRTHQIRVQAEHIGHPVVNDDKYGDRTFNRSELLKSSKRMALHSSEVWFVDQNNEMIKCEAELDTSFNDLIDLLK